MRNKWIIGRCTRIKFVKAVRKYKGDKMRESYIETRQNRFRRPGNPSTVIGFHRATSRHRYYIVDSYIVTRISFTQVTCPILTTIYVCMYIFSTSLSLARSISNSLSRCISCGVSSNHTLVCTVGICIYMCIGSLILGDRARGAW